ncbi:MAG: hypothetical protein M0D53_11155 [Flavobacterium sp. JAD_PAG50586_2]|nr:MAG: hypothetical protein M0D53_11155 [Flavobacterium sp. JAD_PAG50586_2]
METKDYLIVIIIIVLALGAGLYSAYQYIDGVKKDKENKERSDQLIDAQEKALHATEQISEAQEKALQATSELKDEQRKTIIKAEELIAAQNKISELQDETLKQITGGNAVPKLSVFATERNVQIRLLNDENYSIRNVRVVYDIYLQDAEPPNRVKIRDFHPGDLLIKSSEFINNETFADSNDYICNIWVAWLNGVYRARFHFKKDDAGNINFTEFDVNMYTEGLDMRNALEVNGKFAKIIPEEDVQRY